MEWGKWIANEEQAGVTAKQDKVSGVGVRIDDDRNTGESKYESGDLCFLPIFGIWVCKFVE